MHRQQHNPQEVDDLLPLVCGTLRLSGPHSERMPILLLQLPSRLLSLLGQTLKMISFFTFSPLFSSRRQIKTNFHIHNQPSHSAATPLWEPMRQELHQRPESAGGYSGGSHGRFPSRPQSGGLQPFIHSFGSAAAETGQCLVW